MLHLYRSINHEDEEIRGDNISDLTIEDRDYKIYLDMDEINRHMRFRNLVFVDAIGNMYDLAFELTLTDDDTVNSKFSSIVNSVDDDQSLHHLNEAIHIDKVSVLLVPFEPIVYPGNPVFAYGSTWSSKISSIKILNPHNNQSVTIRGAFNARCRFHDGGAVSVLTETINRRLWIMDADTGKLADISVSYIRSNGYRTGNRTASIIGIEFDEYVADKDAKIIDQQLCRHESFSNNAKNDIPAISKNFPLKHAATHRVCKKCGADVRIYYPTIKEIDEAFDILTAIGDWASIRWDYAYYLAMRKPLPIYRNQIKLLKEFTNAYMTMITNGKYPD